MEFGFEGGQYTVDDMPTVRGIPIGEILKQHKVRYIFNTKKCGDIVLKHMSKRMFDRLEMIRAFRYPKSYEIQAELEIIMPLAMAEGAEDDVIERANTLALELKPATDLYMLGCIEFPFITTLEELDLILQALEPEEYEAICQMLILLTDWTYAINYSDLEIAERFKVPMIDADLIKNITYEQHRALYAVIEQEQKEIKKLYSQMEGMK